MRRSTQTLGMTRPNAVVAVGVLVDQLKVLLGADHRARVARQRDDGQRAKHGIDRPPLETKLAKMRACQERSWCLEKLCCHRMVSRVDRCYCASVPLSVFLLCDGADVRGLRTSFLRRRVTRTRYLRRPVIKGQLTKGGAGFGVSACHESCSSALWHDGVWKHISHT